MSTTATPPVRPISELEQALSDIGHVSLKEMETLITTMKNNNGVNPGAVDSLLHEANELIIRTRQSMIAAVEAADQKWQQSSTAGTAGEQRQGKLQEVKDTYAGTLTAPGNDTVAEVLTPAPSVDAVHEGLAAQKDSGTADLQNVNQAQATESPKEPVTQS